LGVLNRIVAQLTKELEQETEHSKTLQAKLSSKPSATLQAQPLTKDAAPEDALLRQLQLTSDLTGLLIQSNHLMADGWSFNCILGDIKNLHKCTPLPLDRNDSISRMTAFSFKLQEHISTSEYSYHPSFNPTRDENLKLNENFHGFMRFKQHMVRLVRLRGNAC
jgi:hypothetical protein